MPTIEVYHQPDGFLVTFYLRHRRMSVEPVMDAVWLFTCTTYTPFGTVDKSSEYDVWPAGKEIRFTNPPDTAYTNTEK